MRYVDPSGYNFAYSEHERASLSAATEGAVSGNNDYNFLGGRGSNGRFNFNWDPLGVHANDYFYTGGGKYENWNGDNVSIDEVFNNSLSSDVVASLSLGANGSNLGYDHLYLTKLDGQYRFAGSIGGEITGLDIESGYFKTSSTNTLAFVLAGNGEVTSWGEDKRLEKIAEISGHVSTAISTFMLGADLYVAEEGGWKSTSTFRGFVTKLGDWHYSRVGLSGLSKTLNVVGHAGTVLGAGSAAYSGYKVYNQFDKGGFSNINAWDAADAVMGFAGTASTVIIAFNLANPVFWAGVGIVATGYGVVRLGMWICE